jgi:hypothetical protein
VRNPSVKMRMNDEQRDFRLTLGMMAPRDGGIIQRYAETFPGLMDIG